MRRATTLALLAAAALAVGACGEDEGDGSAAATSETITVTTPDDGKPHGSVGEISTDVSKKPAIPKPEGDPPTELYSSDVVAGTGATAKAGDTISVHYVGVSFASGEQFDASWDGGQPFSFTLGAGNVIQGWDQGVEGMKIGGRRLLVIPPDLAYGEAGQGPIGPNETLVFAIDLLNVSKG